MSTPTASRSPLILGEVLFDRFPDGRHVLGGAPFNVAWNVHGMGFSPCMVTAVGSDEPGDDVRNAMSNWGMSANFVQTVEDKPTGAVEVTLKDGEPVYDILKERAWDYIEPPQIEDFSSFSYLYYGSLAYRSERTAATIRKLIEESGLPRFVDLNVRPPWFDESWVDVLVDGADWLKLNHDELQRLTQMPCETQGQVRQAVDKFRTGHKVANFCITSGSKGAFLATEDGDGIEIAVTKPDPLVDTVGAGDGFASVLLAGLISGRPLRQVGEAASRFAGKVCENHGATCQDKSFYEDVFI
ncbi:PfkB family carbohydrate kinase [Bremerella sp. T1]|uniref:PfkB family carbohydrate kinase n=1 Tax=Bremerella sp. TYQ1 TaxID=3119568 RepID=UPI001CCABD2E|nr:PfkB family carbohydrate kinase [Bremerella volcania]UBM36585.1 PfkB family carbohydrate kinase [Bremerella volcania]